MKFAGSFYRKISGYLLGVLFVFLALYVGANYFFPDVGIKMDTWLRTSLEEIGVLESEEERLEGGEIVIAYPHAMGSLEPTAFNSEARAGLLNLYEPLVKIDRDLRVRPGLAVSWGRIEENTWEFRLRPGVKFHDGSELDAEDVVVSVTRAQDFVSSELKSLLNNIAEVRKIADDQVQIITSRPDPLLLNKISTVLVFPSDLSDFRTRVVGTGPYQLVSGDGVLVMERFDGYWGEKPVFRRAILEYIPDHRERLDALVNRQADLVINVPPSAVPLFEGTVFDVISRPNLQVNFLLINLEHEFLANVEVRQALRKIFDQQRFVELTLGYVKPVNQFVSNGIFGFNPDIEDVEYAPDEAREKIREISENSGVESPSIEFHLLDGLQNLGEYIEEQIESVGIDVESKYLSAKGLDDSLRSGGADLIFFGWRSELGDAGDFMQSVAHSKGADLEYGVFNGIGYRNSEVDRLIEQSEVNLSVEERREMLREIMARLVERDVIGVPLYESEIIYGIAPGINFDPRIDGYVFVEDIEVKSL